MVSASSQAEEADSSSASDLIYGFRVLGMLTVRYWLCHLNKAILNSFVE